jgi:hypothetical protein
MKPAANLEREAGQANDGWRRDIADLVSAMPSGGRASAVVPAGSAGVRPSERNSAARSVGRPDNRPRDFAEGAGGSTREAVVFRPR